MIFFLLFLFFLIVNYYDFLCIVNFSFGYCEFEFRIRFILIMERIIKFKSILSIYKIFINYLICNLFINFLSLILCEIGISSFRG